MAALRGPRAVIDRLANAVADVDRLVSQAQAEHPGLPVAMLGHSMGGTVALSYTIRHQERLHALVLSGPRPPWRPPRRRCGCSAGCCQCSAPQLPLISIDASLVSRDPAVVRDLEADALNHHGKLPAHTL